MDYLIVCGVAVAVSALSFFSGFGLGTMLMPAFALFFPVPVAVAATAVVHLANNAFKVILVGRGADWSAVARFALPAAVTAILGALVLAAIRDIPPLADYRFAGQSFQVTPVKLVIGIIIVIFAVLDLAPRLAGLSFDRRYLLLGGVLSGFFGGLSGNQGVLRSAFLIKAGLGKQAFIATGVVAAVIVDVTRLTVYGVTLYSSNLSVLGEDIRGLVVAATLAAFAGALAGRYYLEKVTLKTVQAIVGSLLIAVGAALATGLL